MTQAIAEDTLPNASGDQVNAIAQLPRELAIIKMENDNMMALAAVHPRNYGAVLADIKDQLKTFKTFAQTAMYSKPVGKEPGGGMKYARGLSIRAAEALAISYEHNQCNVHVTPIDNDTARVEASFVDYERGSIWRTSGVVSKVYKTRNGGTMRHPDDRFYDVVCKAAGSKHIRECILRSVPPGLRSELEACVNEQLDEFLDDSTVNKVVAQFSQKGVSKEQLEGLLGKRLDAMTKDDRATLLGVWNAIEQGETTVAELFSGNGAPSQTQAVPGQSATDRLADELAKPGLPPSGVDIPMPPVQPPKKKANNKASPEATKQVDKLNDVTAKRKDIRARYVALPVGVKAEVRKRLELPSIDEVDKMTDPDELQSVLDVVIEFEAEHGTG